MGMTLSQKILANHSSHSKVSAGQLIEAQLDLVMGNDITSPVAIKKLEALKSAGRVFDREKVALVLDHFVPNKDISAAKQCACVRSFAKREGISNFFDVGESGVEHVLLPEKGLVAPGELVIGADSHTCTYGALGAFSTGVGSTDMAAGLISGKTWFKIPEAIRVELVGKPSKWVSGKDIILHLIGQIGVEGARYKSLEFVGSGMRYLSIDDRFTIANMVVEAGAKNGIFEVDDITREYLSKHCKRDYEVLRADEDASYEKTVKIDLSRLKTTVACPFIPSNTKAVEELSHVKIDQALIGSCTNGRLSDLETAYKVLLGKKVLKGVRCIIIPATREIYLQALKKGFIEAFIEAGAVVSTPTCGPCLGGYMGVLAEGEVCVATTNRNFVGRMGHVDSKVYLSNPAVAATSAIAGYICNPE